MDKKDFYNLPTHNKQDIIIELRKTHTLEKIANMFDYTREMIRHIESRIESQWDNIEHNLSERTVRGLDINGIHSIDNLRKYKIGELNLMKGIGRAGIKQIKILTTKQ